VNHYVCITHNNVCVTHNNVCVTHNNVCVTHNNVCRVVGHIVDQHFSSCITCFDVARVNSWPCSTTSLDGARKSAAQLTAAAAAAAEDGAGAAGAALDGAAAALAAQRTALGRAVQVDPMNSKLKPPGTKRLKLKCDILLSTSAFKFNLRCYSSAPWRSASPRTW
jgi:hypothetical protein